MTAPVPSRLVAWIFVTAARRPDPGRACTMRAALSLAILAASANAEQFADAALPRAGPRCVPPARASFPALTDHVDHHDACVRCLPLPLLGGLCRLRSRSVWIMCHSPRAALQSSPTSPPPPMRHADRHAGSTRRSRPADVLSNTTRLSFRMGPTIRRTRGPRVTTVSTVATAMTLHAFRRKMDPLIVLRARPQQTLCSAWEGTTSSLAETLDSRTSSRS